MRLASLVLIALPLLQTQPRDGVFVGTLVRADAGALVVRADSGEDLTFSRDARSDMPAGFVPGTRVAVRFEVQDDGSYRAASVSPPRTPSEPEAVDLPPASPGSGPQPLEPRRARDEAPAAARPAAAKAESLSRGPVDAPSARATAAIPSPAALVASPPRAPTTDPAVRTTPPQAPPASIGVTPLWLAGLAGMLAAAGVLIWLARRLG